MNHVTVVICNYNYEHDLAAAIESALAQDYPATRVLIVDDGSADGSRAIIEQHGDRVSAIFKESGGQVSAYNHAIEVLGTEYPIFLDSDDILNAYRESALRSNFPVPEEGINRDGADFYAIYGVSLTGQIATIAKSPGSYRVQNTGNSTSFANSEQLTKAPKAFSLRWTILRNLVRPQPQVELPAQFQNFSYEKTTFCSNVYNASLATRWCRVSGGWSSYFHAIIATPFWSLKKLRTLVLSSQCLAPYSPLSDFVLRYISSPLARRRAAGC